MAGQIVPETPRLGILLAQCPWCHEHIALPEGIWIDGDTVEPWLCDYCHEPLEARLVITTFPVGCAQAVERAIATGQWQVAK